MLIKQKLPETVLIDILKDYSIGKIRKIDSVPTSGNITFLIDSDSGKYILRLCSEGNRSRSRQEILSELELIEYLNKNKFPAPKPIKGIIEYENKFGYLYKYDSGKFLLNPNIEQVKEFGKTLGWLHSLIENYETKNKREHFWDLETTQENFLEIKELILKSNFPKAVDFINKLEKELFSLSFSNKLPQGMIHEDLGRRHVLWKNNRISCILDFDRCYYGKLILDLGQAIRGWCFVDNWQKWSDQNFNALLSGYSEKRKLTDLEKKHLFSAIKLGILERALSFSLRFIDVTQDPEDAEFAYSSVSNEKKHILGLLEEKRKATQSIF